MAQATEKHPYMRSKDVQNIKDLEGGDWFKAKVVATKRRKGEGFGPTSDKAVDEAYKKAISK